MNCPTATSVVARIATLSILCLAAISSAAADIYEWEYINPADPSQGKQESTVVVPGGAGINAQPNANLSNRNLTKAYLIGKNLTNANFRSATLTNADMTSSDLTDTDFYQATLNEAVFTESNVRSAWFLNATLRGFKASQLYSTASYQDGDLFNIGLGGNDLTGWDFEGKNLNRADFLSSTLVGTNFRDANLIDAYLGSSFPVDADFTGAEVRGANFADTVSKGFRASQLYSTASYQFGNLSGIKLGFNNLDGWDFANQNLTNSDFSSLTFFPTSLIGINFSNANLTAATFTSADLSNANLSGAILAGAIFTSAKLVNTDFAYADVRGAVFTGLSTLSPGQIYSTASYQSGDLSGIKLGSNDLSGWNFEGKNLANSIFASANLTHADLSHTNLSAADFSSANLTNADLSNADLSNAGLFLVNLTNANLTGASISGATITVVNNTLSAAQFYSTANYISGDLRNLKSQSFPAVGWNLSEKDFSGSIMRRAIFQNADLSHSNFTNTQFTASGFDGANMTGADARGAIGTFNGAIVKNLIRSTGSIAGLELAAGEMLLIRDYDGKPTSSPPGPPIPIRVQNHFTMSGTGTMHMIFETDEWNSTISFDPGIPVDLGGILDLDFKEDVNITSQIGRTLDLFDWTGVSPTGTFAVQSPYGWDLTNLYTTGEVTLLSVDSLPGDFDNDGDVDGRDLLAWQRDPSIGSLTAWQANYGDSVAGLGAFAAVPEPASAVLVLVAYMLTLPLRKISY